MDDLCGGLPVDGPVHFILHGGEKVLGGVGGGAVVDTGGEDVEDFTPEDFLGRADVANPSEESIKVRIVGVLFEAFVVEQEALHQELAQLAGRPDAELCAAVGFYAVADGNNDV